MEKKIIVKAGFHQRRFCPVGFVVEENLEKAKLVDLGKNQEVPCQLENGKLSWIVENLEKGEEKKYLLSDGMAQEFPKIELEKKEDTVDIKINNNLFSTYHFGKNWARPFLNPAIGPTEKSLLRELFDKQEPPDHDHIHHRGILSVYGDINGVDCWSEEEGHGFTRHNLFKEILSGSVYGKIVSENSWFSKEKKKLLTDTREIKFYNLSKVRIIDFKITFKTTEGKVTFGDTKEGGIISVRMATSLRGDIKGKIENGYSGIGEAETWGKRAPWCDYSGPLESERVGLAIFDNPNNFRYPTYWHVRNYGLMTANPFALSHYYDDKNRDGSHTVEANKEFKFSYRIYIHKGDAQEGNVAESFNNYINPPEVEIK